MNSLLESEHPQDQTIALLPPGDAKMSRLERIIGELITELGLDLTDQHFAGTPARVARLYRELTRGYRIDPTALLKTFDSSIANSSSFPTSTSILFARITCSSTVARCISAMCRMARSSGSPKSHA